MQGILLAGGLATRLPNKPLLPQRDGRPVCFSGLDYLLRHKANPIAVVVPPSSVIVDVIAAHYPDAPINFIYQPEARGVGDAINLAATANDSMMIVSADNIYPADETITSPDEKGPHVIVRRVAAWRIPYLVRVGPDGKLTRTGPGKLALTSPWVIFPGHRFSLEGWPDLEGSRLIELPGKDWWDIGTPDTYAAYWRSKE